VSLRPLPPPGRCRVMGVLNLTPDSFSDGGLHAEPRQAVEAAVAMVEQGAGLIDVGAVSTRPGAEPVPPEAEWERLAPVLGPLRSAVDVPLSLVAESFSGPIAIRLLAKKEFDFAPSVLCATFCKSPLPVLSRLAGYMPEKLFGSHALSRTVVDLWVTGSGAEPELVGKAQELLHRVAPETFKRRIGIVDDIDVSAELKTVEAPLLYIQATRDRVVFADSGAEIVKQAQNIRLEKVDGSHMILQTRPEKCAELIIEHILGTRFSDSSQTSSSAGGISQ